jgi:hypothetical protein
LPTSADLNGVAYGNGRFIAGGNTGALVTSTNGIDWETDGAISNSIDTVAFAQGRFFLGAAGGVYISATGENWMNAAIDGTNWLRTPSAFGVQPSSAYTTIAAGDRQLLAAGTDSAAPWATAPLAYFEPGNNRWFISNGARGVVAFGRGRFVVAEMFDTNRVPVTLLSQAFTNRWNVFPHILPYGELPSGICHGDAGFVVVGGARVAVSSDGTNWTTGALDIEPGLKAVTYGNGLYVAVGTAGLIATSPDGLTWTVRSGGVRRRLNAVSPDDDEGFVAVGSRGTVLYSQDGTKWNQALTTTSNNLRTVVKGDGKYVAAGDQGTILSGTAVTNLVSHDGGTERTLNGLAYGGGTWIAAGDGGTIITSTDAESWTVRPAGITNDLLSAAYGGGHFVAVGAAGAILSSIDGVQWQLRSSPTNKLVAEVVYGNGIFLAVTLAGPAIASFDGETWEIRSADRPPYLTPPPSYYRFRWYPGWKSLSFGDGLFVASAEVNNEYDGLHFTSTEGRIWTSHPSVVPRTSLVNDIAYNNGRLVTAGNYGRIFQSDPIVRLEVEPAGQPTQLRVRGPRESTYRIESAASVAGPWELVTGGSSLPAELQAPAGAGNRFYRAVLEDVGD